jgi:hypothetical protein
MVLAKGFLAKGAKEYIAKGAKKHNISFAVFAISLACLA